MRIHTRNNLGGMRKYGICTQKWWVVFINSQSINIIECHINYTQACTVHWIVVCTLHWLVSIVYQMVNSKYRINWCLNGTCTIHHQLSFTVKATLSLSIFDCLSLYDMVSFYIHFFSLSRRQLIGIVGWKSVLLERKQWKIWRVMTSNKKKINKFSLLCMRADLRL